MSIVDVRARKSLVNLSQPAMDRLQLLLYGILIRGLGF